MSKSNRAVKASELDLFKRLAHEERPEYDALVDMVQYLKQKQTVWQLPDWKYFWGYRWKCLDPGSRLLYFAGLLDYQEKGFSYIFRMEKEAGRLNSEHTLDRRLKLLEAQAFLERHPHQGGRGHRVKFTFFRLSEVIKKLKALKEGKLGKDIILSHERFMSDPPEAKDRSVRAKELAVKLKMVHLDFAMTYARDMEYLTFITNQQTFIRTAELYLDELKLDFGYYMVILARNYRDVMSEGIRIFYENLEEKYGVKIPRIRL